MKHSLIFGLLATLFSFIGIECSQAASFDCDKASTRIERTICFDDNLSQLDSALGQAFQKRMGHRDRIEVRTKQREWIHRRDEFCSDFDGPDFKSCLTYMISKRWEELTRKGLVAPYEVAYAIKSRNERNSNQC